MQTSGATSQHHFDRLTIEPFAGTVTVRFSDAIVAATDRAKIVREDGHEPVFYVLSRTSIRSFSKRPTPSAGVRLKGPQATGASMPSQCFGRFHVGL